jgi:hypothetical protein
VAGGFQLLGCVERIGPNYVFGQTADTGWSSCTPAVTDWLASQFKSGCGVRSSGQLLFSSSLVCSTATACKIMLQTGELSVSVILQLWPGILNSHSIMFLMTYSSIPPNHSMNKSWSVGSQNILCQIKPKNEKKTKQRERTNSKPDQEFINAGRLVSC